MTIIRRLPWPELLCLLVCGWLCLALDASAAARLPGDRFVFPMESQPELESRLQKFDREMAEMSRLLMMPQETKKGALGANLAGSEKPPAAATGKGKVEIGLQTETSTLKGNLTEKATPRNQTNSSASESKAITFVSDPESNSQRPWDQTEMPVTIMPVLEPRITLETTRICPEGFTLSATYCRKNA